MYGYNEILSLDPEEILQEVTQEQIFGIFLKQPIIIGKGAAKYTAPYRNDSIPDCYFVEHEGKLFFVDFASSPPSYNCFSFIQKCAKLKDLGEAQRYIIKVLGLKGNVKITKEETSKPILKLKQPKKQKKILYLTRPFDIRDKNFWSQYGISSENLKDDKVIPIQVYQSTSRENVPFTIRAFDIMYAYTDFKNDRIKIYRPYGTKESKWFTNCTQNDIGGINYVDFKVKDLIITKSYKDYRVIKNLGINTVWFQNEGMIPSPTILKSLCKNFKRIIIWFDNDEPGKLAAKIVANHIQTLCPNVLVICIHLDEELLEEGIKDPSDLYSKKGKEKLIEFMVNKNILKI